MIKTIFFDLDDTLLWDKKSVKQAFIETCRFAQQKYQIDPEKLEDAVRERARELYSSYSTYSFTQMIGINPFEGLWGEFLDEDDNFREMSKIVPGYRKQAWTNGLKDLGIDDPVFGQQLADQFPIQRKKHPFVYDETFSVLEELHTNYQLLLLTNGSPDLQKTKLTITPELKKYFDHIVISGDFGRGKPDPAIFENAAKMTATNKQEIIMVGDNLMTDILGSNRAGIKNIWINRENKASNEEVIPTYEVTDLDGIKPILAQLNQ